MEYKKVMDLILTEDNLKLRLAKDRTERANVIKEDYGICWLIAYCIANSDALRRIGIQIK